MDFVLPSLVYQRGREMRFKTNEEMAKFKPPILDNLERKKWLESLNLGDLVIYVSLRSKVFTRSAEIQSVEDDRFLVECDTATPRVFPKKGGFINKTTGIFEEWIEPFNIFLDWYGEDWRKIQLDPLSPIPTPEDIPDQKKILSSIRIESKPLIQLIGHIFGNSIAFSPGDSVQIGGGESRATGVVVKLKKGGRGYDDIAIKYDSRLLEKWRKFSGSKQPNPIGDWFIPSVITYNEDKTKWTERQEVIYKMLLNNLKGNQ